MLIKVAKGNDGAIHSNKNKTADQNRNRDAAFKFNKKEWGIKTKYR